MVSIYMNGHVSVMPREKALDIAADCYIQRIECRIMYGLETILWIAF